jgi:carbon monoxide dehydrogenase subunit G
MKFENQFDVAAPVDEVYATLLDLEKVAPAMPGAQVTDHTAEDEYKVAIKVKLGPMTMNYKGDVVIGEKDPQAHRATMHVKAREARGQGNATADVVMALDEQGSGTHATIEADVQLAGKAAAMGRGLIEDVSGKLVDQFAGNLQKMLSENGGPRAADGGEAPPPSQDEGIDALGVASSIASERARDPKVIAAAVGIVLLIAYLLGRRR